MFTFVIICNSIMLSNIYKSNKVGKLVWDKHNDSHNMYSELPIPQIACIVLIVWWVFFKLKTNAALIGIASLHLNHSYLRLAIQYANSVLILKDYKNSRLQNLLTIKVPFSGPVNRYSCAIFRTHLISPCQVPYRSDSHWSQY